MKHPIRVFLLFFVFQTVFQPFYGIHTASAFSVGEEREVGEQLLTMVRKEFKLIDEPDITQYINNLGQRALAVAGPQFFNYHFFVINNKELNAFAAPSGLIFFHSGLIESLDNEGELVGVVAHEIGHVVSRHLATRMEKNAKISAATMLGVLVGIAVGAGPLSEALISGSMAAGQSAALSFSRQDEEEADRLAFKWMQDQNRNPAVMVDMLRKIYNINRLRQGYVPPYLLTHPNPGIRMGYIQDLTMFNPKKEYKPTDEFLFQRFKSRILCLTKDPMQIIAYYQTALTSLAPDTEQAAWVNYTLSQAYLAAADYENAEAALRRTIAFYPDRTILKADLGVLFMKSGRYDEALTLLQDAKKEERDNAYTTFYLAMTLEKTGKVQAASDLYEELLVTIPDYTKLYYQLANVKAALGQQGEGFYYYGYYYWYEGDLKNAQYHFTKAITLLPGESYLKTNAETMLKKIAQFEKEK